MRCGVANFGQRPEGSINAPNFKFLVPNSVPRDLDLQRQNLKILSFGTKRTLPTKISNTNYLVFYPTRLSFSYILGLLH